jgi:hypothetical protein
MAERLEFDTPAAAPQEGSGRKLEFDTPSREKQLRAEYGKEIMGRGEPGYGERFIDAATLGTSRPLSGLVRGVGGLFDPNSTFGERYRAGVGAAGDYFKKGEENTPGALGVATDIAGSLAAPPVGKIATAGRAAVTGGRELLSRIITQGATAGAVEGAARNAGDPVSAGAGAVIGGAVGGATSGTVGAAANRLTGKAVREVGEASRGGTGAGLKAEGGEIFEKLDNAGIHFSGKETPELANKANAAIAGSAYSRNVPSEINGVLKEINERSSQGAMTYGDVRKIQTQISNLKAHNDKGVRSIAKDLGDAVDDFMNTAKPTMPASSVGKVAPDDLTTAKDLYRRGSQAEKVEGLAAKGTRTAPDPTAKTQKNFERYSDRFADSGRYNPLKEHMGAVDEIVAGSPKRAQLADLLNTGGNKLLSATGLGVGGAALGAATGSFDPEKLTLPTVAAGIAGLGLKGGSNALRRQLATMSADQVNALLRTIVTGSATQTAASGPRAALAKIAAGNAAARGAGAYGGSFVEKKE